MPFSVYSATVPVYETLLTTLLATLDKSAAHAAKAKVAEPVYLTARLYPDMWDLTQQVRAVCNHAIRGTARLAGVPIPVFEGTDASFADLKARVSHALAHVRGIDPKALESAAEKAIVFPSGDTQRTMSGADYLLKFSLPNFYFHLTTTYDILRHNGVPLVKDDFIGVA